MTCKWRSISIQCPDCNISTDFKSVCSSGDGEILFQTKCPKCKVHLSWRVFASALAYRALCEDLEDEKVKQVIKVLKPRTPVQPPLALPEPPTTPPSIVLSEQDRIELRGMGISDDTP